MIGFVGLSHLSLCYASSALNNKYKVVIFDFEHKIKKYKNKDLNFFEPQLDELLEKYKNNFKFSSNFKLISKLDIVFTAIDLKTDKNNKVIYTELKKLLSMFISKNQKIPLVIMSQVGVGFTRKIKWKDDFKFHFVETLVFGNAVNRAINPERIIIGKSSKDINIPKVFKIFLNKYKCKILELTYEESELTKGFINTYLASQLITTNYLNEISSKFGADWQKIKLALQLDKRIGIFSYLKPGLGISGGNIERDLKSQIDISSKLKFNSDFSLFLLQKSNFYKQGINRILNKILNPKIIGILGYTYKENTLSVKNSPQLMLTHSNKYSFFVHDRRSNDLKKYESRNTKFKDLNFLLSNSTVVVIFHDLSIYKKINFELYTNIKFIIDPFSIIKYNKPTKFKNIKYFNI